MASFANLNVMVPALIVSLVFVIAPIMALTAAGFTKAAMISAGLFFGLLIFGLFFYRKD